LVWAPASHVATFQRLPANRSLRSLKFAKQFGSLGADERIAMAKTVASVSKNSRDTEVEETYFKLLIAQRQLISAEWKLRSTVRRPLYASASAGLVRSSGEEAATMEDTKAVGTAAAIVRELTATLNRAMGWPDDTELELAMPDPLVENISLRRSRINRLPRIFPWWRRNRL
jgi:hypothetical protein